MSTIPDFGHLSSGYEVELAVEEESLNEGLVRYRKRTQSAVEQGRETGNDYGKQLLVRSIEPLEKALGEFLANAGKKPGRQHAAIKYLSLIEADKASLIACRCIFDGITKIQSLQGIALQIGNRIEDEIKAQSFEQQKPYLYRAIQKNLSKQMHGHDLRARRSMLQHSAKKFGIVFAKWPRTDKVHIGSKLIDLFIQHVGLVQLVHSSKGARRTTINLVATPELTQWIAEYKARGELMAPFYLPMVHPPRPWSTPTDGGYYHKRLKSKLVKVRTKGYARELATQEMPAVYKAVNALQNTPWRVSKIMLELVTAVWESGLSVKDIPSQFDKPLPAKPDRLQEPEAYKRYKHEAAKIGRENLRAGSKRMQVARILGIAQKFAEYPAIWFPVQLDFRGRMYTLPQYLNPQGCDLAKGLLTFAEGKPLGDTGVFWLAVHVANSFGYDKCSLQARAEWTHQHSDQIREMMKDPLSSRWWMDAEKPFQFLAACVEWYGYLGLGKDYICSLPILVDGSCNGLQHFSAMLRDEVGGRHVNLVSSEKPADIYQAVADAVIERMKEETENVETASRWLAYGINRKTCKRPVMILPYAGTREAVRKYIELHVDDRAEKGQPPPFENKTLMLAINYLAGIMWKTMNEFIIGPRFAMDWLRDTTREVSKTGRPVNWVTPSGFLVQQAYPSLRSRCVDTRIGDKVVKVSITEETDKLDVRKQSQAVSPNFVHSMDASALVLTICSSLDNGMSSFAAIHDSYGTLAADMDRLQTCLRQSFVEMYQRNDVLEQFLAGVRDSVDDPSTLPSLPVKGTLDLNGVLQSDFFFA